jgi:hypothetical protein
VVDTTVPGNKGPQARRIAGIETPIFVGIGGLILGIILMFASWPFFPGFFRRKWFGTADPRVLEDDATYRAKPVVPD